MSTWKRDAASGLIVLTPLFVIVLVLSWLYEQIAQLPFINTIQPVWARVLIAIVVFVLLVFSVGYLMRTALGRVAEEQLDSLMNRVPLIRVLYNASKLAVETALTGTEELQKPVRLETWPGIRMTAFKTGKTTEDGKDVLFMPTAPNITTGFVIEVDPERVEPTDERVEEALTRILSAGFAEDSEPGLPIEVSEEAEESEAEDRSHPAGGD